VISPVNGFLATVALAGIATRKNLTPAPGCQDHTTSPSAGNIIRLVTCRVHRIPLHVRDDRERPSFGTGRAKCAADLGGAQSEIFFSKGLDDPNQLDLAQEIGFYVHTVFAGESRAKRCGVPKNPTDLIERETRRRFARQSMRIVARLGLASLDPSLREPERASFQWAAPE
jgi:hypothetical protein